MGTREILEKASERPVVYSASEIKRRRETVFEVMLHRGNGLVSEEEMKAVEYFTTGQLSDDELVEFIREYCESQSNE